MRLKHRHKWLSGMNWKTAVPFFPISRREMELCNFFWAKKKKIHSGSYFKWAGNKNHWTGKKYESEKRQANLQQVQLQRRRTLIIFLSAQQVLLLSPAFRNYRQNKTQYQRITELETEKQLLAAEAVKGKSRNEPAWQKTCMMDWEAWCQALNTHYKPWKRI